MSPCLHFASRYPYTYVCVASISKLKKLGNPSLPMGRLRLIPDMALGGTCKSRVSLRSLVVQFQSDKMGYPEKMGHYEISKEFFPKK